MRTWFRRWKETLHIMIFERELYRNLRESIEAPDEDFTEVGEP